MGNNLHISYDLNNPGKNYAAVIEAIKGLGSWAKVHKSFWYVNSSFTADQALANVWSVMDASDQLYIVDATNNLARWKNLPTEQANFIADRWNK